MPNPCSPASEQFTLRRLFEQVVYRKTPTRNGRFRFGRLSPSVDGRFVGIVGAIDFDYILVQQIHVPNYLCARLEVVGDLLLGSTLGSRAVVVLAAYFDSEDGRSGQELHAVHIADVPGGIRAERVPI